MIIHHPFLEPFGVTYDKNFKVLHYMDGEEELERARAIIREKIEAVDDVFKIFMLINKPYSLSLFQRINEYLSEEDFATYLRIAYQREEFPNRNPDIGIDEMLEWFDMADETILMEEDELKVYDEILSEEITIYRGVGAKGGKIRAISWTDDINVAKRFQKRYSDGILYKAKIKKEDVYGYWGSKETESGDEQEVLCNPYKIYDIEELS